MHTTKEFLPKDSLPGREETAEYWRRLEIDPLNFPNKFLKLQTVWDGAEKIILSTFNNRKTAVKGAHAMSKDWTAGIVAVQWLFRYYPFGKVIVTGPTDRQVKEIVFTEIEKQFLSILEMYPDMGLHREMLTTNKLEFGTECFALGFTTKEANELVGKFQGFHSPNMLIIITEAGAVPHDTFKQIKGLTTSVNSRVLEIGNPIVPFGDFYDHCTEPRLGYNVITLSAFDSPNVIANREVIPGMVTREWIEELKSEIGSDYENDPDYQARVLAEFPQYGANAWIPLAKIKSAVGRILDDSEEEGGGIRVGGLDTAREGDDETVHSVLHGRTMTRQDCFRKVLTPETIGWARSLIEEQKLEALAIDEGYNPGVKDMLDFDRMPVMGINFGVVPSDERFANMGTYIWFLLRQAIMDENISIINDPILISQLASRKVEMTPQGKKRLESKKKIKKSPDRADALALAWYARMMIVSGEDISADPPKSDSSRLDEIMNHVGIKVTDRKLELTRREEDNEEFDVNDIGLIGGLNSSDLP